jgi:hypothetical protein
VYRQTKIGVLALLALAAGTTARANPAAPPKQPAKTHVVQTTDKAVVPTEPSKGLYSGNAIPGMSLGSFGKQKMMQQGAAGLVNTIGSGLGGDVSDTTIIVINTGSGNASASNNGNANSGNGNGNEIANGIDNNNKQCVEPPPPICGPDNPDQKRTGGISRVLAGVAVRPGAAAAVASVRSQANVGR